MYWKVAINHLGVLRQICLGRDPNKVAQEQKKIKKDDLVNKYRIQILFTKCKTNSDFQDILSENWMNHFRVSPDKFYFDELEKIAAKYDAAGTMASMRVYEIGVNSESDKIEILVNVDAKDYSEFHKKFGGLEGAIELLYSAERVYGYNDPAKAVLKWVKKLELEMEE